MPSVFVSCLGEGDSIHKDVAAFLEDQNKSWSLRYIANLLLHYQNEDELHLGWHIPSGKMCHATLVSALTATLAALLCLWVLFELAVLK